MFFALLAGILSTLSPCVLPLIPIVLASAATEHRLAPLALAAGVALSFTALGIFIATIGFAIGLDTAVFRPVAALLLILLGAVLVAPRLQAQLAVASGPVGNWTQMRFAGVGTSGVAGQFGVGLLLGAVWTPCVGPTLGAASVLAARGEDLSTVALTMLAFGIGTSLPLLAVATLSREALLRWRGSLLNASSALRAAFGGLFIAVGLLTLSGADRIIQAALERAMPDWLRDLTTRF
jgi:cytochrome c-type biogenesis protein